MFFHSDQISWLKRHYPLQNSDSKTTERELSEVKAELAALKKDLGNNEREQRQAELTSTLRSQIENITRELNRVTRVCRIL
jgi:cell shape-determining protein MreC